MAVPNFLPLIARLENAAETERLLLPHSGNATAALFREAAEGLRILTRYALYYEQKAGQARTEPIRLIVDEIPPRPFSADPDVEPLSVRTENPKWPR